MPLIKGYIKIALSSLIRHIETHFNKDKAETHHKHIRFNYEYSTKSNRTAGHIMPTIVHVIRLENIAVNIGNHAYGVNNESKTVIRFEKNINLDLHLGNTQINKVDYHLELLLVDMLYQQLTKSETIPFLKGNI